MDSVISQIKNDPIETINSLSESKLDQIIKYTCHKYYDEESPIISDEIFDIMFNKMKEINPNYTHLEKTKDNSKLPIWMGSMNKIKPDTDDILKWKKKYSGPYLISDKLDGISALFENKKDTQKLYTRTGNDISHIIPYLNLPNISDSILIRGELVIDKSDFKLFEDKFADERHVVSGIVNCKNHDDEIITHLKFIAYQVINFEDNFTPHQEIEYLKNIGLETVSCKLLDDICNHTLSVILSESREKSKYLIDGIIIMDNKYYPLITSGNPKHAFAFKMIFDDQKAESIVTDVIWQPSKYGYLKPRIRIEPVLLKSDSSKKGIKIEYLTGKNARYIINNKIGIGSIIELVRGGDVIPEVTKVLKSSEPKMPDCKYHWNETQVEIILDEKDESKEVKIKRIHSFFAALSIKGVSIGIYTKLYDNGYDNVKKILNITVDKLMEIETIKEKSANNIYNEIQKCKTQMTLINLMIGCGVFGRGFGKSRLQSILITYPYIREMFAQLTTDKLLEKITDLSGFNTKTAKQFVNNFEQFNNFIIKNNLTIISQDLSVKDDTHTTGIFKDKTILFTGFKDKELTSFIENNGGKVVGNLVKNLNILIAKDLTKSSNKLTQSKEKGITIYSLEQFNQKYR